MSSFDELEGGNFGVVLILPHCAFTAELPRGTMSKMMQDIDDILTEQGAPEESETRSIIMVDNAMALSNLISTRQVENSSGVADIAYSFVYAFCKAIGFEQMDGLRGLTGSFLRNKLILNPCLSEIDFKQESDFLSKKMEDHQEDEEWDFDISLPPTVH